MTRPTFLATTTQCNTCNHGSDDRPQAHFPNSLANISSQTPPHQYQSALPPPAHGYFPYPGHYNAPNPYYQMPAPPQPSYGHPFHHHSAHYYSAPPPPTQNAAPPAPFYHHPSYIPHYNPAPHQRQQQTRSHENVWYGRTKREVAEDNDIMAPKYARRVIEFHPKDPKPDDLFEVHYPDGSRQLRDYETIEEVHYPGKWRHGKDGVAYFVKETSYVGPRKKD
ncbi:hypothetical protein K402DRAFT_393571 [Aulographum hederae CBS 113979]|uniref:Uncharacterized protein n=1 Tax=Aulographum hederae CBS 113979 TaxID=1176131 RepID=A0A6G1H0L4_9PEZI|nr:hypothetical protein K402DRAFT_393571 [Aulographum hederae CBS 113979]